jgi:hypothetical protein
VRSNKGSGHKFKANLKLKRGNFPRTFKIEFPKSRNQRWRKKEVLATYVVRRGTSLLHV